MTTHRPSRPRSCTAVRSTTLTRPAPASSADRTRRREAETGRGGAYTVCVRFTPSDIPGLTSRPAHRTAVIRAAGKALDAQGRGYLGGHLEITSNAPLARGCTLAASEQLAAARAVENALHGGCGTVRLPLPDRWPDASGEPCDAHGDPCSETD
ncbi:hypothetical protein [Streptomyces sp. AK02-01A]|uniref:hypothetical protein n=1 Tax=Streptomyces sp. AK02-01A TaxID=3028648 RepID=UPI0029A11615|nr:hypothetical protein [Streptomyces sp. AK02-01A]MDX3854837.1 hypothetical protein [Streptomyces sp. AK02-01A]